MRSAAAWWGLLLLGIILIVVGIQGSLGRMLAVVVTPNRLKVEE